MGLRWQGRLQITAAIHSVTHRRVVCHRINNYVVDVGGFLWRKCCQVVELLFSCTTLIVMPLVWAVCLYLEIKQFFLNRLMVLLLVCVDLVGILYLIFLVLLTMTLIALWSLIKATILICIHIYLLFIIIISNLTRHLNWLFICHEYFNQSSPAIYFLIVFKDFIQTSLELIKN